MSDEFDDDTAAMRMLAFVLTGLLILFALAGIALGIIYFRPMYDFISNYGWVALVLLFCGYIAVDTVIDNRRQARERSDAARIDALEDYRLSVLPSKDMGGRFMVARRDGEAPQLVGIGGVTVREAIDSALLELFPPARRAEDRKGV